jgi:hypothetical protein
MTFPQTGKNNRLANWCTSDRVNVSVDTQAKIGSSRRKAKCQVVFEC